VESKKEPALWLVLGCAQTMHSVSAKCVSMVESTLLIPHIELGGCESFEEGLLITRKSLHNGLCSTILQEQCLVRGKHSLSLYQILEVSVVKVSSGGIQKRACAAVAVGLWADPA